MRTLSLFSLSLAIAAAMLFMIGCPQPVPVKPQAAFTAEPVAGVAPLTVQFTNQSTPGTYPISTCLWTFGDGSQNSEASPSHEYLNPGTYTVSLTVTTTAGTDIETKVDYIEVQAAPQEPAYSHYGCGSDEGTDMAPFQELGIHWKRVTVTVPPLSPIPPPILSSQDAQILLNQSADVCTYVVVNPVKEPLDQWPEASVFAAFLGALVERYDGDGVDDMPGLTTPVFTYEICNEIDTANGGPQQRWAGFTDAMYLDYMQRCYSALHQACGDARLFCGALTSPPVAPNNETFARLLANGGTPYFDAISYHSYTSYLEMDQLQQFLTSQKTLDKPIFITESDMSFMYYTASPRPDAYQLANLLVQSYAYALAHDNVEVVIFTELQALARHPVHLQWAVLMDIDGTRRPAYYAYKKLIALTDFYTDSGMTNPGEGIYCTWFQKNGQTIYVVWADQETTVTFPVTGSGVRVMNAVPDASGVFTEQTLAATGGTVQIAVGDYAKYVEPLS